MKAVFLDGPFSSTTTNPNGTERGDFPLHVVNYHCVTDTGQMKIWLTNVNKCRVDDLPNA